MPLPLNQADMALLPVLDALLQERSVTRAASQLGRSQPAVSHALSRLRMLLGNELLVRVGRRYELTTEAEEMVEPLHALLQQLGDVLTARPTFDARQANHEYWIATSDYLSASILHPVIQKIAVYAPGIRLSILDTTGADLAMATRNTPGCIAIYPSEGRPTAPGLDFDFLTNDSWCCAAWAGNTLIGDELTQHDFESLPHIIEFFTPSPDQTFIGRFLKEKGSQRRQLVKTSYIFLIPFLLRGTSALAVLPRRVADWLCEAADLRIFPLPFDVPDFAIEMCWSTRYTTDPAHSWIRSTLKDAAQGPTLTA